MFEARSGSAEIDENDVNEALDAGTDEGTRQALSFKMGRDVEMESTRGESRDEGGEDETRARHSEHKARRDDGNVLPRRVKQRHDSTRGR